MKESDKYKTENFRLKEDVLRLKYMLSEFQHSKLIINSVEKKHYLGKISKEHDCWFSQDLILDT